MPRASKKSRPAQTPPASSKPEKTAQPHGGALYAGGVPGNKGGGRTPNWLKDWCDGLLADEQCKQQVEEVLRDKSHPAFATLWRTVAERAHGKPVQPLQHSGALTLEQILAKSHESGSDAP